MDAHTDSEKTSETEKLPLSHNETLTINLPNGPIAALNEGDLIVAQGIPHSQQKRFSPPLPLTPWTEPLDCTRPGPLCPQLPFDFEPLGDMVNLPDRPISEDCLTVNVVAPLNAQNLPVLVWIHGGAYVVGTGDLGLYDTRGLARKGMVVVSIQYRLGVFGYAQIPGIAPANLGLMDQIVALKWVQENVHAFGGDASRVTIFGQSAGADSVYSLLLAEGTEALFHRAVLMSSPFGLFHNKLRKPVIIGKNVKVKGDMAKMSTDEVMKVGEKILAATKRGGLLEPGFYVAAGEKPMPPTKAYSSRLKERAAKIPIMIGWTKHDVLPFLMMIPVTSPLNHLPVLGKPILLGLSRIFTYQNFAQGSKALHRQYLKDGGRSVAFKIEWYPKGSKFRAAHCMESPLLFGGYDEWSKTPLLGGADRQVYEKLSREMKNLLGTFVEGGSAAAQNLIVREDYEYLDKKS